MSARQISTPRSPGGLPGLLLAVLGLVGQLALGAVVLPDEASAREQSISALDALTIVCASGTPVRPGNEPSQHRHGTGCGLCPINLALSMPAAIPSPGPTLPPLQSRLAERAGLPPDARGPPTQPRTIPLPRGPPVLG